MDYFSVLYPAVAALNPNDPQTRAALYIRARKIVTDRVPATDNTRLSNELLALESAIRRIEKEFLRKESSQTGGRRSAFLGSIQSYLWPPQPYTVDLGQRSGLIWKSAAAVSVILAVVIGGGIGLSYLTMTKPKPAPYAEDTSSKTKAADAAVEDPGPGADQRPYTLRRQLVYYRTTYPPGALVISKSQKFLYLIRPNVVALRYSIAISRKCADSVGLYQISDKEEFPGWNDPAPSGQIDILTRNANPLGARALYFERDDRRIHGVSKAVGVGYALSCFQLINEDVIDLFDRVPVGTRVVATN
jgi:lipoprotein-anchoring transpeptidase ErfK/SrfK